MARVEAARRVGYDELPVLVASGMSTADIKAYRIADDKLAEMSPWDRDVLKLEFEAILEIDSTFDLQYSGYDTAEPPELDFEPEQATIVTSLLRAHIESIGYSVGELARILTLDETELPELYDLTELMGSTPVRPKGLRVIK